MKKWSIVLAITAVLVIFASTAKADMCEYYQWKMKPCKAKLVVAPAPTPQPVKEEVTILEGVYFDTGKATIKPESHPVLDKNVKKLHKKKSLLIEIIGYTDNVGNDKYNQRLSASRAMAVKEYFVGNGIAEERIVVVGMGEANPIADNSEPEGRAKNRRIEIKHKK